jgi:uracil-DNA glycosylase
VTTDLDSLDLIREAIGSDPANATVTDRGWQPLYVADPRARVAIIGQAPGLRAQESGVPWNDASGRALVSWLGVTPEQFHDPSAFALLPMDFYFPGKGAHGDLPPRRDFAARWHPPILRLLDNLQIMILIGAYAQRHYLKGRARANLTETVRAYQDYLPEIFPLVHPSPLNFRWRAKNPWFESVLLPDLRVRITECIG